MCSKLISQNANNRFLCCKGFLFTEDYTNYEIPNSFLPVKCHCQRCISRVSHMLFKKKNWSALTRWLSWLHTRRSRVWFLVRAHAWVVDSIPGQGTYGRQPIDIFLSYASSLSLPLPLSLPSSLSQIDFKRLNLSYCVYFSSNYKSDESSLPKLTQLLEKCAMWKVKVPRRPTYRKAHRRFCVAREGQCPQRRQGPRCPSIRIQEMKEMVNSACLIL